MRKSFIALATAFTILGITFVILPLGTIALLPIGLALLLGFLAFKKSEDNQQKFPKLLLIIASLTLLVAVGKTVFIKNEVVVDKKFNQEKIESKKEAQQDLEELEGLE